MHTHICGIRPTYYNAVVNCYLLDRHHGCGYVWEHKSSDKPSHNCPRCGKETEHFMESANAVRAMNVALMAEDTETMRMQAHAAS